MKEPYTVYSPKTNTNTTQMSTNKEACAYVTAWARTTTPPAQRLGLRGESDAMVDRCVLRKEEMERDGLGS